MLCCFNEWFFNSSRLKKDFSQDWHFWFLLVSKWRFSCWTRPCLWLKFLPHCEQLKGLVPVCLLILWRWDKCPLTNFAEENTFSHKLQPNGFFSVWILWCKLRSFGVKKVLSHKLHLWFLIPVWIFMCFDKSPLSIKDFSQWTQDSGFTPRWTIMWRFRDVLLTRYLSHWEHL